MGKHWNGHCEILAPTLPGGAGPIIVLYLSKRRLIDWNLVILNVHQFFGGAFWTTSFSIAEISPV